MFMDYHGYNAPWETSNFRATVPLKYPIKIN
jgi:hypothetical protein